MIFRFFRGNEGVTMLDQLFVATYGADYKNNPDTKKIFEAVLAKIDNGGVAEPTTPNELKALALRVVREQSWKPHFGHL